MAEENNNKHEHHEHSHSEEHKHQEHKHEPAEKKEEKVDKKQEKKVIKQRKTEALVNGRNLEIGRKHAVALCDFVRRKDIDVAIKDLEQVVKMKKAIPMKGEIPHRHDMHQASGSGRYPVKGAGIFIKLLKSLKSNAIANELELEKFRIFAMANRSSRPYKRFGQGRMKRAHVQLKLIPIQKQNKEKKKN